MLNETMMTHSHECRCFSWRPVIAGSLIAVGLAFLVNLFCFSIGLTAYTTPPEGSEALAWGGLIGLCIGIIASMFAAGWLTGYMSRSYCSKRHIGAVYGFLTWIIALIISVVLMNHTQEYVTFFYNHFVSSTPYVPFQKANVAAANVSTQTVTSGAFVLFGLFFLSAFSCSLGGHCGMRYHCNEECHPSK